MTSIRAFNFPGSTQRPTHWLIRWLVGVLLASVLTACSAQRTEFHAFGFDIRRAVPAVEVLDYRYGISGLTGTSPGRWEIAAGKVFSADSVGGTMHVGDTLYVKWRIKDTGEVFEKTVDLKSRLPSTIENQSVYFDIQGQQLYIYLVSLFERRPSHLPPNGPSKYHHALVRTLYPDPSLPQQVLQKASS